MKRLGRHSSHKFHIGIALLLLGIVLLSGVQTSYADAVLHNIDIKNYPTVKLLLSNTVLQEGGSADKEQQAVEIRENGKLVENINASSSKSSVKVKPEPISVIMLIDASGSMKGKPIDDAKAAAINFVNLLGEDDKVSIVAFNSVPSLIADNTSDKKILADAISAIQASGETAVYDALSLATNQVATMHTKQNYIVLLSDGGDTVSKTKPQDCINQLKNLRVPVYTVALKSPEFDVGILNNISSQSGGKLVQAIDSSELKPFYSRIAQQIKTQIEITYKSPGFTTKDINLDITIGNGSQALHVSSAYNNPAVITLGGRKGGDAKINPIIDSWFARSGILLFAFLASVLFAYGVISLIVREKSPLREQIGLYESIWHQGDTQELSADETHNPYISKALDVVGYLAEKRGFVEFVKNKLEQASLPLRPTEYIFFHMLLISVPSVIIQFLYGRFFLSVLFIILLTAVPMLAVQTIIDRRQRRFNTMLPDTITMIASSLRAGYSLLQAVALVADESTPPMSVEFKRALTEARLGLPIELALEKIAKRVDSEDFRWMVLAINIQREVGGNLAEVLDIVAGTIREKEALRRQVKALSAEGRLSAYILLVLPFVVAILLFIINPQYIMLLFTNVLGWFMVGGSGILMVIGAVWMKKLVSIEV